MPNAASGLRFRLIEGRSRRRKEAECAVFVKLARTIRVHKVAIHAAVVHGLSDARVESLDTKLRLIMRRAVGFEPVDALIGLAWIARQHDWEGQHRDDPVFTWTDGTVIGPDRFSAWFRKARSEAGLRPIRLHDLRHTYATVGLARATRHILAGAA